VAIRFATRNSRESILVPIMARHRNPEAEPTPNPGAAKALVNEAQVADAQASLSQAGLKVVRRKRQLPAMVMPSASSFAVRVWGL